MIIITHFKGQLIIFIVRKVGACQRECLLKLIVRYARVRTYVLIMIYGNRDDDNNLLYGSSRRDKKKEEE